MCAAVVVPSNPLNVTLICNVLATSSITIVAVPVPGDALDGDSFRPFRNATNVFGAASARDALTVIATAMPSARVHRFKRVVT